MTFPADWKISQLQDCLSAIIDYRGKTPEKTSIGIPLVTAKIVKNGRIETPNEFIAEEDYDGWMTRGLPEPGDVVITTEAPLGEVAQIGATRVALAQRIILLRADQRKLDNTYLKYCLSADYVQTQLRGRASGTTVTGIKQSELRKVEIALPPLEEQRNIAEVLRSLDDKIELNRRMNATLEAMAQALFKSWFVDFDPVKAKAEGRAPEGMDVETAALFPSEFEDSELGLIPKGWSVKSLSECCDIARGASPRPIQKFIGHDIPWVKIADATGAGGPFIFETKEKIIADGKGKSVYLEPGSLILSNSATCGLPFFLELAGCIHDGWLYFKNYRGITAAFLFYTLGRMSDRLIHEADGSVQKNLNTGLVSKQRIVVPSRDVAELFEELHGPLLTSIRENTRQIQSLGAIRDELLPKLISGQLRVPEAEEVAAAVM